MITSLDFHKHSFRLKPNRFLLSCLVSAVGLGCGSLSLLSPKLPLAWGATFSDGTVVFEYPPQLDAASTTRNQTGDTRATYYYTFDFPTAAAEPLRKVEIELSEGRRDPVFRYRVEDTRAFVGDRYQRGEELPLSSVVQDEDLHRVSIIFDPPVTPGQTFTIALHPERNPRFEGVYLFGVTTYPAGETGRPQFAGYGRLSFYRSDGGRDVFR